MKAYVCLYDRSFNPLGQWSQHVARSWSLKRKAYENDEFQCECVGFENSKDACFVGLFTEYGKLKYVGFAGMPATKDRITAIEGIDCRSLFDQEIYVDYASASITKPSELFDYLTGGVFTDLGIDLGVSYRVVASSADDISEAQWNNGQDIPTTAEVRNVYDEIMKFCSLYDCVLTATAEVDTDNNYYLAFTVARIYEVRAVKLSDYDAETTLDMGVTNAAIAQVTGSAPGSFFYLYKDNTVGSAYDASLVRFPPIYETFEADTLAEAEEEAREALLSNRFQDRVTIDLTGALGKTLKDLDFTYWVDITGYNPADLETVKRLPVSAIYEDSNGGSTIEFGRLSEYWFMD